MITARPVVPVLAVACTLTLLITLTNLTTPIPAEAASATGSQIVASAKPLAGTRYCWGGSSTRCFDCSGFVGYVLRQRGFSPPRDAASLQRWARPISRSQLRPGDLVFMRYSNRNGSRADHVDIYLGNGRTIGTSTSRGRVVERPWIAKNIVSYGRVPGVIHQGSSGNVTRAQAANIVAKELNLKSRRNPFGVRTHSGAVGAVHHAKIAYPYRDGLFRPNVPITNHQLNLWMGRANATSAQEARIRAQIRR
jgi:cell wall-associated NlpC family hydrolase